MFMFILGVLTMSLISTVLLIIWDNATRENILLEFAGGPAMLLYLLCQLIFYEIPHAIKRNSYKAILQKEDGSFWYCNSKYLDIIEEYIEEYKTSKQEDLEPYFNLWDKRYSYGILGVNSRYAPRKFWKMYAKPIPKEDIKEAMRKEKEDFEKIDLF